MSSGRNMPVDDEPIKVIVHDTHGGRVVDGFIPHWVTCTEPEKYRKQKLWKGDD